MHVVYIHGLESSPHVAKVAWLRKQVDTVYAPDINYRDSNSYIDLDRYINAHDIDLIYGSSMGGFYAYTLGKKYGIPVVLFNPALHSRTLKVTAPKTMAGYNTGDVYLGKDDNVIDPKKTEELLDVAGDAYEVHYYDGGHRVPDSVFKSAIKRYL